MQATTDVCFYDFKVNVLDDSLEFIDQNTRVRVFVDPDDITPLFTALSRVAMSIENKQLKEQEEKA